MDSNILNPSVKAKQTRWEIFKLEREIETLEHLGDLRQSTKKYTEDKRIHLENLRNQLRSVEPFEGMNSIEYRQNLMLHLIETRMNRMT